MNDYMAESNPTADSAPPFSDDWLALRFAHSNKSSLRYVRKWQRWLVWDGRRWQNDDTLRVMSLVRDECREAASQTREQAAKLASGRTIEAVERLARSDRRLAATVDQWDRDVWSFNTPAGVIDLRTGELHPPRPEEYITKVAGCTLGYVCSTWITFLHRITGKDTDLQSYLQRVAGYTLTGSTKSQAMFFFLGTGANGKSTFLEVLAALHGDYYRTATMETFMEAAHDRHLTEVAHLQGARLVVASETERGRRWAESRIKSLTGGDRVAARFMRQDLFEFTPTFKLIVAGNHPPGLHGVNEALKRRVHIIPFRVTIPVEERDEELVAKLKSELPGILAWALDGCRAWQATGLCPPQAVDEATASYFSGEDVLGDWMAECCSADGASWSGATDLFNSWSAWASQRGEPAGSIRRFSQALTERGLVVERRRAARGFRGLVISLPPSPTRDPSRPPPCAPGR